MMCVPLLLFALTRHKLSFDSFTQFIPHPPWRLTPLSRLSLTREKIYKTVARQMHGVVPCWVCGQHVPHETATLEHIQPLSQGGNSHLDNLAISHEHCNNQRHAQTAS